MHCSVCEGVISDWCFVTGDLCLVQSLLMVKSLLCT